MKTCSQCPHPALDVTNALLFGMYSVLLFQPFVDPFSQIDYPSLTLPTMRYSVAIVLLLLGVLQGIACYCDFHSEHANEQYSWCRRRALCAWAAWLFWWMLVTFYFTRGINVLSAGGALVWGCTQLWQYLWLNAYIRKHRDSHYGRTLPRHASGHSPT